VKDKTLPSRPKAKAKAKARLNEPVQRALDSRKTFDSLPSPAKRVETAGLVGVDPSAPALITGDIKLVDGRPIQGGRRGKLTAQQKWQRWANLLSSSPAAAKTYYRKHSKDIRSIETKPNEVYTNTPVEHVEVPDPMAQYGHAMRVWQHKCHRRRAIILQASVLLKKRNGVKRFTEYCKQHPDVYEMKDGKPLGVRTKPAQPVEPEEARTAPKLDGRTGIRKEATAKARAITTIQKKMAEERRKAKAKAAKAAKPAPVMRHPLPAFSISAADDTSALMQASPCELCRVRLTKSWNRK
jgi:hypothetical protein